MQNISKNFIQKNKVIFTFHINWKVFNKFGLLQYQHIINQFANNGIKIDLLPILTDRNSFIELRVDQFKKKLERMLDNGEKANVISYSFSGIEPKLYINALEGDKYISNVLTIGCPHK